MSFWLQQTTNAYLLAALDIENYKSIRLLRAEYVRLL